MPSRASDKRRQANPDYRHERPDSGAISTHDKASYLPFLLLFSEWADIISSVLDDGSLDNGCIDPRRATLGSALAGNCHVAPQMRMPTVNAADINTCARAAVCGRRLIGVHTCLHYVR